MVRELKTSYHHRRNLTLVAIFLDLFCVLQNPEHTFANFEFHWAYFPYSKRANIEKLSSHLVTLEVSKPSDQIGCF